MRTPAPVPVQYRRVLLGRLVIASAACLMVLTADLGGQSKRPAVPLPPAARSRILPPNIVLMVIDDLGYSDIGTPASRDIPTPNIERLFREGMHFSDGYMVASLCSPSRAGIVTGRYPQRFGLEFNPGAAEAKDRGFGIPADMPTIAQLLKAKGYATGMFGKWHLGYRPDMQPTGKGFDEFFGFLGAQHSYRYNVVESSRDDPLLRGTIPEKDTTYLTKAFAREAVSYIARHKSVPFFLYVPFNAVHEPFQSDPATEARVKTIASAPRRTFASMLVSLDDAVGDILGALEAAKISQNTLVILVDDNGGAERGVKSSNDPLRGAKGGLFEGGIRVPFMIKWPGHVTAGATYSRPISGLDIVPTVLDAVGSPLPPGTSDGVSLLPFITGAGASGEPHAQLFWRLQPAYAVREGRWKLIGSVAAGTRQLFDLTADIREQRDLASQNPRIVEGLQKDYDAWASHMSASTVGKVVGIKKDAAKALEKLRVWFRR